MEYVKLEEICTIVSGGTPSRSKPNYWNNGNIPWIKIKDMKSKYIDSAEEFITEEGLNNSSTKMLKRDTILYSIFATLGEVGILKIDACTNQAIAGLSLKEDSNILKEYLYYYLKSKKKDVNNLGRGVAQNNINLSLLRKFKIPVIPLRQQKKIVEVLDIVSSDKNSIKRGPFGGALKKEDFLEDGYMVYEQRHAIHEDFEYAKYYVSPEKYESMIGFKVVPGDLIISCSGTLGRIAEVPMGAKEGIINQALLKISLNKDIMNNQFFIYQFRCKEIQDMLFGISRGSGIANMPSMNEVKAFKFICPPLEIQNQFASFVQEIDKSRLLNNHSLLLLKSIIF
ncbi:restriction endonuclease subunit S [Catenibacterium sp.]|uniref:restriction endonuclease subunit S n=1 Tax=Catenibacterium sp. TaxID=2049022 RepID=UPI003FD7C8BA